MSGPIATYGGPEDDAWRNEDPIGMSGTPTLEGETDMRMALVRLEEQMRSIQRDQANTNTTMREGFKQIGENLGKNADVLKEAFATFRNDFVPKQEYATVAFQVKVMWGVITALGALVLTMTAKGLFSGVTL